MNGSPSPKGRPRRRRRRPRRLRCARVMILRDNDGVQEVLLAQRAAHDTQALTWEFPGGAIDTRKGGKRETPSEAAARETLEELGLHVKVGVELAQDLFRVHSDFEVHTTLFTGTLVDPDEKLTLDAREVAAARWFTFDAIPHNINRTSHDVLLKVLNKDAEA